MKRILNDRLNFGILSKIIVINRCRNPFPLTRLTIQPEKIHFSKVDELRLTQVDLFYFFFHFMCVVSYAAELFYKTHLANIERFLHHFNLSFKIANFICM